jgi:hypothetical protein
MKRYELLLQNVMRYTPDSHPDYEDLQRAISLISQVARFINNVMTDHETAWSLAKVEKKLIGYSGTLVKPGRRFVDKAQFIKVTERTSYLGLLKRVSSGV